MPSNADQRYVARCFCRITSLPDQHEAEEQGTRTFANPRMRQPARLRQKDRRDRPSQARCVSLRGRRVEGCASKASTTCSRSTQSGPADQPEYPGLPTLERCDPFSRNGRHRKADLPYDTDGWVVKVKTLSILQRELGTNSRRHAGHRLQIYRRFRCAPRSRNRVQVAAPSHHPVAHLTPVAVGRVMSPAPRCTTKTRYAARTCGSATRSSFSGRAR